MALYEHTSGGTIDITYTGNYETYGYINSLTILSNPSLVVAGQTMASFLANVRVRIQILTSGGLATSEEKTLLDLLGTSVVMRINNVSYPFSATDVQQGMLFPNVEASGAQTLTIEFTTWFITNTETNTTYSYPFSFSQAYHSLTLTNSGDIIVNQITKDIDSYHIAGFSDTNLVLENGSLYWLFQKVHVSTNVGDFLLWDLIKYGFSFSCNMGSYTTTTLINNSTIRANALATNNLFFSHSNKNGEKTRIVISLSYFDTNAQIDKFLFLTFDIALIGIRNVNIIPLGLFPSSQSTLAMFRASATTTDGTTIFLFGDNSDFYNSVNYTFFNDDTSTSYNLGDTLPNGHYSIEYTIEINPLYTIQDFSINKLKIYQTNPTSFEALLVKNNYRVGSVFNDDNVYGYLKYLIYGDDYYTKVVYSPTLSTNYHHKKITNNDYPTFTISVSAYGFTTTVVARAYYSLSDNVYIVDKKTLELAQYGEIQQNFNMNFVLDKTKDNAKIRVLNRSGEDIKPNTIVYLESTDTWWIVNKDKVQRYEGEINPLWQHDISLQGAFEILNARDLTNCGFNVDHYAISQFLERLIKLSDFEIPVYFNYGGVLNPTQNVDFLKTFANYTPASAIREFCDGYNATPKMSFEVNATTNKIEKAIIYFISNSGVNDDKIDISTFDCSEETITSDKENYGSKVVSNIQNVVSGKVIRYPAIGTAHISSEGNKVQYENAVLRLPTKANYVKALEICGKYVVSINLFNVGISGFEDEGTTFVSESDCYNSTDLQKVYRQMYDYNWLSSSRGYIRDALRENEKDIIEAIQKNATIYLENGADYIQVDKDNNWSGYWNDKAVKLDFQGNVNEQVDGHPGIGYNRANCIGLNDKKHYDTFPQPICMIYWEQGSDLIKNFRFYSHFTSSQNGYTGKWHGDKVIFDKKILVADASHYLRLQIKVSCGLVYDDAGAAIIARGGINLIGPYAATYVVHYIPMTDMKIKVENGLFENDTDLYNQNGTMVGAKAVSKLVNSHAISISSNQITRKKRYYNFFDIPSVGQIVENNGVDYIINNVSIDFAENDNNDYALDVEFGMTKNVACKSTMISANTNIRDYDTPQNNNIYRTQTYRDIICLGYEDNGEETYMPYSELFNIASPLTFSVKSGYNNEHTALMKIKWSSENTNYYQLPAIKYELENMIVEVIDFKDNNIIGYAVNNSKHPFQMNTWWVKTDLIQTPISYVDDIGHLIGLDIKMCDNEQLTEAYNNVSGKPDVVSLYSASCIIPQTLYDNANSDALISEPNYDKDGLEIPMFIYSCQSIDNEDLIINSGFFNAEEIGNSQFYVYCYAITDRRITKENALALINQNEIPTVFNNILWVQKGTNLIIGNNYIDFEFQNGLKEYDYTDLSIISDSTTSEENIKGKNIIIYRCLFDNSNPSLHDPLKVDFFLGINNCQKELESGKLRLYKIGKRL